MKRLLFILGWFISAACGLSAADGPNEPRPLDSEKGHYDQAPVLISTSRPQYPFEMRRKGAEGDVTVEFTLDTGGRVREAKVVAAPHKDFERAALYTVESAKFKPATKEGKAVAVRMQWMISYRLGPSVEK